MAGNYTTFSFLDVVATITGPNGTISLGNSSGPSEEGISVSYAEDQVTTTIGADGTGMHSLHAGQSGMISVRFLKSSPTNALLQSMYAADRSVPSTAGQNTIAVSWIAGGDVVSGTQCAFKKFPDNVYAKDAAMLQWEWNVVKLTTILGNGS